MCLGELPADTVVGGHITCGVTLEILLLIGDWESLKVIILNDNVITIDNLTTIIDSAGAESLTLEYRRRV